MVILQFNRLIRNKWVWGAFAVVISAAFCFDDMFTTRERERRSGGEVGKLGGEAVEASDFESVADDVRGLGRNRDWRRKTSEVNRMAWEVLGTLSVARRNGIEATDAEVRETIRRDRSFAANGQFSFSLYQRLLRENSVSPERFEAFLKRRLTTGRIEDQMLDAATWVSPAEIDLAVADMTDTFTVRVARLRTGFGSSSGSPSRLRYSSMYLRAETAQEKSVFIARFISRDHMARSSYQ